MSVQHGSKPFFTNPRIAAILLAGGTGSRFSSTDDKLLAPLHHKPVLAYSAAALFNAVGVTQRIVVCAPEKQAIYVDVIPASCHPIQWASAGASRRQSVQAGLAGLTGDIDWVLIHDAARPLVTVDTINAFVNAFSGQGGSSLAHPVVDTIKQRVSDEQWVTLPRQHLWAVETPQLFEKKALLTAHATVPNDQPVTDDLQLLELAQTGSVILWPHHQQNLKITHPTDIAMAEVLSAFKRV